jgi:hypothetical protein
MFTYNQSQKLTIINSICRRPQTSGFSKLRNLRSEKSNYNLFPLSTCVYKIVYCSVHGIPHTLQYTSFGGRTYTKYHLSRSVLLHGFRQVHVLPNTVGSGRGLLYCRGEAEKTLRVGVAPADLLATAKLTCSILFLLWQM